MFKFDNTLELCVSQNIKVNMIPMLLGEPGIGKSSWLESLAESMHTKCFTVACNQLADKADLTGARLVPTGNNNYKQMFYPHADIQDAIEYATSHPRETPILFLDELNRTTPDVTSAALSIPTMRKIGSASLPSNLRIVIAGNDKGNIVALDEASISRFILYHVEPDINTFMRVNPNLNQFVKETLNEHPECLFCKTSVTAVTDDGDEDEDTVLQDIIDDGEEMAQITTPRTITALSEWLNGFNLKQLETLLAETHMRDGDEISTLQEVVEGHVGRTNFTTFLLAKITSGIMNNVSVNATSVIVGKPTCYDDMKACKNMSDLNDFIANMSDRDKSGCVVYALQEALDNDVFIKTLAPNTNSLESDDAETLMKLRSEGRIDSHNAAALMSTKTPLSNSLGIILNGLLNT